jgi:hypothetical protein
LGREPVGRCPAGRASPRTGTSWLEPWGIGQLSCVVDQLAEGLGGGDGRRWAPRSRGPVGRAQWEGEGRAPGRVVNQLVSTAGMGGRVRTSTSWSSHLGRGRSLVGAPRVVDQLVGHRWGGRPSWDTPRVVNQLGHPQGREPVGQRWDGRPAGLGAPGRVVDQLVGQSRPGRRRRAPPSPDEVRQITDSLYSDDEEVDNTREDMGTGRPTDTPPTQAGRPNLWCIFIHHRQTPQNGMPDRIGNQLVEDLPSCPPVWGAWSRPKPPNGYVHTTNWFKMQARRRGPAATTRSHGPAAGGTRPGTATTTTTKSSPAVYMVFRSHSARARAWLFMLFSHTNFLQMEAQFLGRAWIHEILCQMWS